MAEQVNEATQPKQTTRFQYPRGDTVIGEFFAANVYKSAALIDVIYLFHLDYGADADVSQILRERLMEAARSGNGDTTPTPPATKRTVVMPDETVSTEEDEPAQAVEFAEPAAPQKKKKKQQHQDDAVDNSTAQTTEQSNTDVKSSDFDIAEMFD